MGAPKQKWTDEEEVALRKGVERYGPGKWRAIQKDPKYGPFLTQRSNVDLKDKWRIMNRAEGEPPRSRKMYQGTSTRPAKRSAPDTGSEDDEESAKQNKRRMIILKYGELITEAVAALNEAPGSTLTSIAKYIEDNHAVPFNFRRLIGGRLKTMVEEGMLIKGRGQAYRLNDGTATESFERRVKVKTPRMKAESERSRSRLEFNPDGSRRQKTAEEAAKAAALAIAEAEAAAEAAEQAMREAELAEQEAAEAEAAAEAAAAAVRPPKKRSQKGIAALQEAAEAEGEQGGLPPNPNPNPTPNPGLTPMQLLGFNPELPGSLPLTKEPAASSQGLDGAWGPQFGGELEDPDLREPGVLALTEGLPPPSETVTRPEGPARTQGLARPEGFGHSEGFAQTESRAFGRLEALPRPESLGRQAQGQGQALRASVGLHPAQNAARIPPFREPGVVHRAPGKPASRSRSFWPHEVIEPQPEPSTAQQGLEVSGQGSEVSGQGLRVAGQGFGVSGQGLGVSVGAKETVTGNGEQEAGQYESLLGLLQDPFQPAEGVRTTRQLGSSPGLLLPQSSGVPQGSVPAQASVRPQVIAQPQLSLPPQIVKKPQGLDRPQGLERPQAFDRPQNLERPQGSGRPQNLERPQGLDRPQGLGWPQGFERPQASTQPQAALPTQGLARGLEPSRGVAQPQGLEPPHGLQRGLAAAQGLAQSQDSGRPQVLPSPQVVQPPQVTGNSQVVQRSQGAECAQGHEPAGVAVSVQDPRQGELHVRERHSATEGPQKLLTSAGQDSGAQVPVHQEGSVKPLVTGAQNPEGLPEPEMRVQVANLHKEPAHVGDGPAVDGNRVPTEAIDPMVPMEVDVPDHDPEGRETNN